MLSEKTPAWQKHSHALTELHFTWLVPTDMLRWWISSSVNKPRSIYSTAKRGPPWWRWAETPRQFHSRCILIVTGGCRFIFMVSGGAMPEWSVCEHSAGAQSWSRPDGRRWKHSPTFGLQNPVTLLRHHAREEGRWPECEKSGDSLPVHSKHIRDIKMQHTWR